MHVGQTSFVRILGGLIVACLLWAASVAPGQVIAQEPACGTPTLLESGEFILYVDGISPEYTAGLTVDVSSLAGQELTISTTYAFDLRNDNGTVMDISGQGTANGDPFFAEGWEGDRFRSGVESYSWTVPEGVTTLDLQYTLTLGNPDTYTSGSLYLILDPVSVSVTIPCPTPSPTATTEPTATATTEPTATATDVAVENGSVAVTIVTEDGREIPDDTIVCFDLDCRDLDDVVAAAAPSGTTVTFEDKAPGDHPISVTVGDTLAASQPVTVVPGETTNVTILLPAADTTPTIIVTPPGDGGGQPVDPDDGDGSDDDGSSDDGSSDDGSSDRGSSGGDNGSDGGTGGYAPVTSLPSTGTGAGDETPASAIIVLFGGILLIAIAGGLTLRGRHS